MLYGLFPCPLCLSVSVRPLLDGCPCLFTLGAILICAHRRLSSSWRPLWLPFFVLQSNTYITDLVFKYKSWSCHSPAWNPLVSYYTSNKIQTPYLGPQAPPSPGTLLSAAFSLSSNPSGFLSFKHSELFPVVNRRRHSLGVYWVPFLITLDWVVYSLSVSLNSTFLWRSSQAILSLNDLCLFLCPV